MEIRNNRDLRIYESAARTATPAQTTIKNEKWRGGHFVLDVTAAGTGSITLTIEGFDGVSAKWYTILAGVAVTANGTTVYRVYPSLTAAANSVASDVLPHQFRVTVTHNNANAITYSVGGSLVM